MTTKRRTPIPSNPPADRRLSVHDFFGTIDHCVETTIAALRRHARGESTPAEPWHTACELAAAQAVLAPAAGVTSVGWPPDPALAALVLERWAVSVLCRVRAGDPRLAGPSRDRLAKTAICCPARLLGVPDRDGNGTGRRCKVPGCPCCHAHAVALTVSAVEGALRKGRRTDRAIELAVVPAIVGDKVRGRREPIWAGRIRGGGHFDLVAATAATDWDNLPWPDLVDGDDWPFWEWRAHFRVDPSPEGIARAVARVRPYDATWLTCPPAGLAARVSRLGRQHATGRRGVFRSPTAPQTLAQVCKPGHARRCVGSTPAEGACLWRRRNDELAARGNVIAERSRLELEVLQLQAVHRRLACRGLPDRPRLGPDGAATSGNSSASGHLSSDVC